VLGGMAGWIATSSLVLAWTTSSPPPPVQLEWYAYAS